MTDIHFSATPEVAESMHHAWQGLREKKPGGRARDDCVANDGLKRNFRDSQPRRQSS